MAACDACGGMGKVLVRQGRLIGYTDCPGCSGTGRVASPYPQNYPPEVVAALQMASQAQRRAVDLRASTVDGKS